MDPAFRHLIRLEPRLLGLYQEALTHPAGPGFCAMDAWGGRDGLKMRMHRLVGYCREDPGHPDLFEAPAYDAAYRAILGALPACRGGCGHGGETRQSRPPEPAATMDETSY